MKGRNEELTLDDVLDLFLAASEQSGQDALDEWVARYPQFENEIREFAAYNKIDAGIPDPEYTEEEKQVLEARAVSVVQNILYEHGHPKALSEECHSAEAADETITGILDEAERQQFTIESFAEQTNLSEGIIWTLDSQQVRYETIAIKAVENIAAVLGKLISTIKRYLRLPMQPAYSHYKAQQAPEAQPMCDFAEVVQMDEDLTDEQRRYWLSQPSIGQEEDQRESEQR